MSLVRRISSASVLAATVVGAVLSLAGAASAGNCWKASGADSTPPGITCCAICHPSVASLDTDYPGTENM
ncbi:hypothetical protein [Amycolatopsis alba]|uniref:hypothetical protein n=1 Tax=Amycolatopsis alba TaxID=76020 RepID=UPI0011779525|nr:hypothetical protein [Amycolatopsis alba]